MACRARLMQRHARIAMALERKPHYHWLLLYIVLGIYFTVFRCLALAAALNAFAAADQHTAGIKAAVLLFGVVEDFLLITLLLVALAVCDFFLGPRRSPSAPLEVVENKCSTTASHVVVPDLDPASPINPENQPPVNTTATVNNNSADDDEPVFPPEIKHAVLLWGRRVLRLASFAFLIALAMAPFAVDNVLLRARGMRFTYGFVQLYVREFEYAAGVHVSTGEVHMSTGITIATVLVAALLVAIALLWLDFSRWHLLRLIPAGRFRKSTDANRPRATSVDSAIELIDMSHKTSDTPVADVDVYRSLEDGEIIANGTTTHGDYIAQADEVENDAGRIKRRWFQKSIDCEKSICRAIAVGVPIVLLTAATASVYALAHAVPAVISAAALNGSLNELFRSVFGFQFLHSLGDGTIESASVYLSPSTEQYELFADDVLYRKTTGFQGDLAFDVRLDRNRTSSSGDSPNVLVIVVESLRAQDSVYLSGNRSANVSLTPNFDRWAKRGVAFSNMWSSWQTSRSIESILFGHVPLDDITETGTTHGRSDVKLEGMPQFFQANGYETTFSTGVRLKFDHWGSFLPAHGFDRVLGSTMLKAYAETDLGITSSEWKDGRAGFWGVHDDVTFQVLGNLMVNKTRAQAERVESGQPKQPFFINHYTLSSRAPFKDTPSDMPRDSDMPDPAPLTKDADPEHAAIIERYARLRYYQDRELGKFLDRMEAAGVLKDTIVVIVGDHGESPESGLVRPYMDEVATTRVAATLLAEGRLGQHAGLIIDDATHQYDLLNTLADIVGVPEGGFYQSSVGRSLKRKVEFGERPVWSNNPMRRMAAVQGHRRLSYDRVFSMIGLFDVETDPREAIDLWDSIDDKEREEWETLRERGRRLSRYFRVRWDKKCITKTKC